MSTTVSSTNAINAADVGTGPSASKPVSSQQSPRNNDDKDDDASHLNDEENEIISVRDRIRLMNRGTSLSRQPQHQQQQPQHQQHQQQQQPQQPYNNIHHYPQQYKHKRSDILSDPGVSSQSESHSAAAAITKWRQRRFIHGGDNDNHNIDNVEDSGTATGADKSILEMDTIYTIQTAFSNDCEKTEWTISDLTRSSERSKKKRHSLQNGNQGSSSASSFIINNDYDDNNGATALPDHQIGLDNGGINMKENESSKENFLESIEMKSTNHSSTEAASLSSPPSVASTSIDTKAPPTYIPRQLEQGESGTFIIPKLRPVRRAPHTLAIIMQQKTTKKKEPAANDNADTNNSERSSTNEESYKEEGAQSTSQPESEQKIHMPLPQSQQQLDTRKPATTTSSIKPTNNVLKGKFKASSNEQPPQPHRSDTKPLFKKGTPQRSKISDRIKAFTSVYSASNNGNNSIATTNVNNIYTSKSKASSSVPPTPPRHKRSMSKAAAEEDASLDSGEKVTVQSHDDDSISVLTPMGNNGTPARLGAQPPTPNSYSSEAAYTAASSGDGAVAGSDSSAHKQRSQMCYAHIGTPDVSHAGDMSSVVNSSSCHDGKEFQNLSDIKNSLQSKLEHDKKKAGRKRITPNHAKVPSVLIAAQKKASDLKPKWGGDSVNSPNTAMTPLVTPSKPPSEFEKDDVRKDLNKMFEKENKLHSSGVASDKENIKDGKINGVKDFSRTMKSSNKTDEGVSKPEDVIEHGNYVMFPGDENEHTKSPIHYSGNSQNNEDGKLIEFETCSEQERVARKPNEKENLVDVTSDLNANNKEKSGTKQSNIKTEMDKNSEPSILPGTINSQGSTSRPTTNQSTKTNDKRTKADAVKEIIKRRRRRRESKPLKRESSSENSLRQPMTTKVVESTKPPYQVVKTDKIDVGEKSQDHVHVLSTANSHKNDMEQKPSSLQQATNSNCNDRASTRCKSEDEEGFIPMQTNAAKDRRSRFMKATNIKRKNYAHNRSLQQKKSETNDDVTIKSVEKLPSISIAKADPAINLPTPPPCIVRSLSDSNYLESAIDEHLMNPSKDAKKKWSFDSSGIDSSVNCDNENDEPEPVLDSFIHSDLSPIKSVDQSKIVYDDTSYRGSPDGHTNRDSRDASNQSVNSLSFEIHRQTTPKRRNRRESSTLTNLSKYTASASRYHDGSDAGSHVSQAMSAPLVFSSLERETTIAKRISELVQVRSSSPSPFEDAKSEASSSVRSTSSGGTVSSRVTKALASRRLKISRMKQEQQLSPKSEALLAKDLARRMLEEASTYNKTRRTMTTIRKLKDPSANIGECKKSIHTEQPLSHDNYNCDTDLVSPASLDTSNEHSSFESEYLEITDGQVSVDADELVDGIESNHDTKSNGDDGDDDVDEEESFDGLLIKEEEKYNISMKDDVHDENSFTKSNIKNHNNMRIDEEPSGLYEEDEGGEFACGVGVYNDGDDNDDTGEHNNEENTSKQYDSLGVYNDGDDNDDTGEHYNEENTSKQYDSLNSSSMSGVRISQEDLPFDEEDQEGFEIEYIPPTELLDYSLSQEMQSMQQQQEQPTNDQHERQQHHQYPKQQHNEILMHFNSQTPGSIPMKTDDSLFAISYDTSSEYPIPTTGESRGYNRKY